MADVKEKEYSAPEVAQTLAKAIKEKLEVFSKEMAELQTRELKKNQELALETLAKKSPPGRSKEVEQLKAKGLPASEAFGIAWRQHDKSGPPAKKSEMKKMGDSGYSGGIGLNAGKDAAMNMSEKSNIPGLKKKAVKKSEDFIDLEHENDPKKRLKNIGKEGVMPGDKATEEMSNRAKSSGGDIKANPLKKDAMPTGSAAPSPPGMPKSPAPKPPKLAKTAIPGLSKPKLPGMKKDDLKPGSTINMTSLAKKPGTAIKPPPTPNAKLPMGGHSFGLSPIKKEELAKEHLGFDKLKNKIAHKGNVSDPAAVAAAVGRKKYGKKKFQQMATAGKSEDYMSKNLDDGLGKCLFCGNIEHLGDCK